MQFKNPETMHSPLAAYSHQAKVSGKADWLVLSGQVGMAKTGEIPEGAMEQLKLALGNIEQNLQAAGMDREHLVKLVFYFVGEHSAAERRAIMTAYFGGHKPCMTVLFVAGLVNPALKVEIDAWACSGELSGVTAVTAT